MDNELLMMGAESISMFCRLNLNTKKNLPIRSSEMGLLILITKSQIEITPIKASEFFKVSKPMIANMIASLEKKHYIIKKTSIEDKRSYILKPTEKAINLVETTYSEYLKIMMILLNKLGKDKFITLINLLEESNEILLKGEN